MRSTIAAVLTESNQPLEVAEILLPERLCFGQVLVEIHFSGVCASQLGEIAAVKGPDRFLPHLLGHEASATVLATGEGVRTVSPGDAVVLHWRKGQGIDAEPARYGLEGRTINSGSVTTFSQHAVVAENRMTAIPSDFDLRTAPLLGCALTTGFGVVNNNAGLKIGQSGVIVGVGGVGLSAVLAARLVSAYPIVAVDLESAKLEAALSMGATHAVLAGQDADVDEQVRAAVGPDGADAVIDTTGNVASAATSYSLTNPTGITVLVGVPKSGLRTEIETLPLHFGKRLTGSWGGESVPSQDIPRYVRLTQAGRLDLGAFPTEEYELQDVNRALDDLRGGAVGRRLIRMAP
ncbi:MAG: zinc-binding dehydrogenase [Candidatus Nanopelagicales bacterium]|nr:zinc-binding dehydrogenase [Candidatus Nanopelagicales bacterium]